MKRIVLLMVFFTLYASIFAQQFNGYKFCIDPGHGGHDPANDRRIELPYGIIFWESEGNLQTAFHLDTILRSLGANTKLTRTANDDTDDISLSERSTIANDFGADFFQSIHTNGGDGTANYSLVLYKEVNGVPAFSAAKNMADIMAPILKDLMRTTDAYSRGDYSFLGFNLGVLRNAQMPSVLSEGAFHDYPEEGLRLKSTWFSQNYAWAIAKSFLQFYNKTGFSTGRVGGVVNDDFTAEAINGVKIKANSSDSCITDENYNGFYALDLAPDNYSLEVSKEGYISKSVDVNISANNYTEFDIQLTYFNNGIPRADFYISGLPAGAGQTLTFDASHSLDPDGSITAYDWNFGDGVTASGVSVNHAFAADGTYSVQLIVTDNDNKKDTIFKEVSIRTNPPDIPEISSVEVLDNNTVKISWKASNDQTAAYRIYSSKSDAMDDFILLADTNELVAGSTEFLIDTLSINAQGYNFKICAVNSAGASDFSDTYSSKRSPNTDAENVLIVDGYDRLGSWGKPTHTFANTYMTTLRDADDFNISSASNDAIISGAVKLSDYKIVVWFLGDESTADETFNTTEQSKVKAYLEGGGYLLVTGSEIAWDLYNKGSSVDKSFYNNYLKATYKADGSSGNNLATGVAGTVFNGLSLNYGQVYPEDYPDEIGTYAGSESILQYKNGQTAGIAYKGKFASSNNIAAVINIGFPLESVDIHDDLVAFMQDAINYFNGFPTGTNELKKDRVSIELFPNPVKDKLSLYLNGNDMHHLINIEILDISGKTVKHLKLQNENLIDINVKDLMSGLYILKVDYSLQKIRLKFIKE
ncbi:MAG: N-acetylmuramoyl-L-alanine amidase [Bacteroidales bacterium]|nr:N-acetylmuramoyl-L-alanine amidase [Bacteroidales bacterium]